MKKIYNSYLKSGVNISAANKFVKHISKLTKKNDKKEKNSLSSSNIGAFGSLYDISKLKIKDPILVSATDGVGTKLDLTNKFKKFDSIGEDLVAMCVNDLIVQGARPLFFLDYIAIGKINLNKVKKILQGILNGCKKSNCKLIGGETAEMPGIYDKNKFDLAGFSVGIISKKKLIQKKNVRVGDIILAIPSSGLHSNGYSLIRNLLKRYKIPKNLNKELLKPTKIYVKEVIKLNEKRLINSAAHITGGGITENLVRSIPDGLSAKIDLSKIKIQKIFRWIKSCNLSDKEMLRTFNCGVGYCLIVNKKKVNIVKRYFQNNFIPYTIGRIERKKRKISFEGKLRW